MICLQIQMMSDVILNNTVILCWVFLFHQLSDAMVFIHKIAIEIFTVGAIHLSVLSR